MLALVFEFWLLHFGPSFLNNAAVDGSRTLAPAPIWEFLAPDFVLAIVTTWGVNPWTKDPSVAQPLE